jgi:hypothetical protein
MPLGAAVVRPVLELGMAAGGRGRPGEGMVAGREAAAAGMPGAVGERLGPGCVADGTVGERRPGCVAAGA